MNPFCRFLEGDGYCPANCKGGMKQAQLGPTLAKEIADDLANPTDLQAKRRIALNRVVLRAVEAFRPNTPPPCAKRRT